MSLTLFQTASLIFAGLSTLISYIKYREYKYEKQRDIYQSIVGNEYEFKITGSEEPHQFTVVNIDVKSGRVPWKWRTMVVIEFDLEEFPWDPHDDEVTSDVAKDLIWTFNLLTEETPDVRGVELFESYQSPTLVVVFPSTDLFYITDFLRKTQTTIGHVFWHYEDASGLTMRKYTKFMDQQLEWTVQNTKAND